MVQGRSTFVVAHVLDAQTGLPLSGQPVTLLSHPDGSAVLTPEGVGTTDAAGAVVFTVVPATALDYQATSGTATSTDLPLAPLQAAVPGPVDGWTMTPGDQSISLTWQQPYDDGGGISQYEITAVPAATGGSTPPTVTQVVPYPGTSATLTGLTNGTPYTVSIVPRNSQTIHGNGGAYVLGQSTPGSAPDPAPVSGTVVCGTLPGATTWTAAGSPYSICRAGAFVPEDGSLLLDGSQGPVEVTGRNRLVVRGSVRTAGTSASSPITFRHADLSTQQPASGALDPSVNGGTGASAQLAHVLFVGSSLLAGGAFLDGDTIAALRTDGVGGAIDAFGVGVALRHVVVLHPSGDGIYLGGSIRSLLEDATVDHAGLRGAAVYGGHVVVHGLSVTASGLRSVVNLPHAAVEVSSSALDLGQVTGVTGRGNGIDAIVLSGTLGSDLTWVPASNSTTSHALGYVNDGLVVPAGRTLTVPDGMTVLSDDSLWSHVTVDGTMTLGTGSVLTSVADATNGFPCPSDLAHDCLPADGPANPICVEATCNVPRSLWAGVEVRAGTVTGTGATLKHASLAFSIDSGTLDLRQSKVLFCFNGVSSNGARSGSLTLIGDQFRYLTAGGAVYVGLPHVDVERSLFTDTGSYALSLVLGDGAVVRDNVITDAGDAAMLVNVQGHASVRDNVIRRTRGVAADISGSGWTYGGADRDVGGFTGGGNTFDSVEIRGTTSTDVTYTTPTNTYADHPLATVAEGTEQESIDTSLDHPVVRTVVGRDHSLGVGWVEVSPVIFGAHVEAKAYDIAVTGRPVIRIPATATRYTYPGLTNGVPYGVHVRAVRDGSVSRWSVGAVIGVPAPPPDRAVITEAHLGSDVSSNANSPAGLLRAFWTTGRTVFVAASAHGSDGTTFGMTHTEPDTAMAFVYGVGQDVTYTVSLTPQDAYGSLGRTIVRVIRGTSFVRSSVRVAKGTSVVVHAFLKDQAKGTPFGNQRVAVYAQSTGQSSYTRIGTVTTHTNGEARMRVTPTKTTAYRFVWAGTTTQMAAAAVELVNVSG